MRVVDKTRPIGDRLSDTLASGRLPMRGLRSIGFFVSLSLIPRFAHGETIVVTPLDSYDLIEGALPGDEVVIAPGTYGFRVHLTQAAPAEAPIVIRAMDPGQPPVWDLSEITWRMRRAATTPAIAAAAAGN